MNQLIVFLAFLVIAQFSVARLLTPIENYKRCNIHLSGQPISLNGETEKKIIRGEVDPIKECEKVLGAGFLNPQGYLANDTKKSRAVLKTMFSFHRNWFEVNTIEQIQGYNEETGRGTLDHYDPNEPALTLTRSLFLPGAKYKDAVTASSGVKAIREEDLKITQKFGYLQLNEHGSKMDTAMRRIYVTMDSTKQVSFRNPQDSFEGFSTLRRPEDFALPTFIQIGDLTGIVPRTDSTVATNVYLTPVDGNGVVNSGHLIPGLDQNPDMFKSQGGGVLGTPIFYMMNSGHPNATRSNGAAKLPRRWIKNAMESLLCSTFPSLRESDITPYYVGNSTTPFRNGKSCLQCHATMDQAATAGRNLMVGATDYVNLVYKNPAKPEENLDSLTKYPLTMVNFKPTLAPLANWPSEPIDNFHLQQPTGDLYFRSQSGLLINRRVANIAELGQAFSETDDYYVCAAKRYFKYFTGVDVALYDKTNPLNASVNRNLTNKDKEFRSYVEKIGMELKSHQSLAKLIKAIMSSKYYKTSDPQSEDN